MKSKKKKIADFAQSLHEFIGHETKKKYVCEERSEMMESRTVCERQN